MSRFDCAKSSTEVVTLQGIQSITFTKDSASLNQEIIDTINMKI